MKLTSNLTDQVILEEIGRRLAKQRLSISKSQAELASECGLARRTIQYAEAGKPVQSESLVKILRSLSLLETLDALLPDQSLRPMDMLKLKSKERKRVAKKRAPQKAQGEGEWKWGDEN
jgi:transcriptional regulator with XRE-family HTH domain